MSETAWTVDEFMDSVRKRKLRAVENEKVWAARFGKQIKSFATQGEAWKFCVERAKGRVSKAETALENERKRLKKCTKKMASLTQ